MAAPDAPVRGCDTDDAASDAETTALGQAALRHVNARQFDTARPLIERALARAPHDGMLAHVKAHLTSDSGALLEGAAYLRSFLAAHDPHDGINTHTSFHLAIHELELARPTAALDWYTRVVSPAISQYPFTLFSAVTILWRMELTGYGAAVRARGGTLPWAGTYAAARAFADPSALDQIARAIILLCTGDTPDFQRLLADVRCEAGRPDKDIVLPLVLGFQCYWHGDYAAAAGHMEPIAPFFSRLSDVPDQFSLLEDTLIEAQLRAGRNEQAAATLQRRLAYIPLPRYRYWLGRAQLGLGQPQAALASFRTARAGWQHAEPDAPEIAALNALLTAAPSTAGVLSR